MDETLTLKVENLRYHLGIGEKISDVSLWEKYGVGNHDALTSKHRQQISNVGRIYYLNPLFKSYFDNRGKISVEIYNQFLKWKKESDM